MVVWLGNMRHSYIHDVGGVCAQECGPAFYVQHMWSKLAQCVQNIEAKLDHVVIEYMTK